MQYDCLIEIIYKTHSVHISDTLAVNSFIFQLPAVNLLEMLVQYVNRQGDAFSIH